MKKFFLILGIVVLSLFGISVFTEFMANHTYYKDMLISRGNRKLVIWAVISCGIPLYYVTKAKVFSLKKFFVWILPAALLLFSVAHTMIKE
jgi:amino acid permease